MSVGRASELQLGKKSDVINGLGRKQGGKNDYCCTLYGRTLLLIGVLRLEQSFMKWKHVGSWRTCALAAIIPRRRIYVYLYMPRRRKPAARSSFD